MAVFPRVAFPVRHSTSRAPMADSSSDSQISISIEGRSAAFVDIVRRMEEIDDYQEMEDIEALARDKVPKLEQRKDINDALRHMVLPRELLSAVSACSTKVAERGGLSWLEISLRVRDLNILFGSQLGRHPRNPDDVHTFIRYGSTTELLWQVCIEGNNHWHEPKGPKRLSDPVFHRTVVDLFGIRKADYPAWVMHQVWSGLRGTGVQVTDIMFVQEFIFYVLDGVISNASNGLIKDHQNGAYIARNNLNLLRTEYKNRLCGRAVPTIGKFNDDTAPPNPHFVPPPLAHTAHYRSAAKGRPYQAHPSEYTPRKVSRSSTKNDT